MKSMGGYLPQSLALLLSLSGPALSSALSKPYFQSGGSPQQAVLESPDETPLSGGSKGAVACESRVCSQIGVDLLAQGGNAVDAWVGAQLCVGVIGMHHSGLGGGGFALIRGSDGDYTVLDYREAAPAAAFENMYQGNVNGSIFGGLASGVPGELRGLEHAHKKFGSLPWKDVVLPSVEVAREGFTVTEDQVNYMSFGLQLAGWNFFVEDPSWAQDFAPDGKLVTVGDVMTRKRYATTLEVVAEKGADVFYKGPMAEALIATIQDNNGTMTLEDMSDYNVIVRDPVNITYHGYDLYSSGVPSSGAVGLSILKTMEGYSDPIENADTNLTLHRFDEAMRFAYGAHQALGDPAFLSTTDALERAMLNATKAAEIRSRILDNSTQPVSHYDPERIYTAESHGTSHIVSVDRDGLAVSSTTTINLLFGSLLVVPETGVILNNEMNDFSIPGKRNEFGYEPSPANFIRPGKRPLSSVSPIMVEDSVTKGLFAATGAAGGSRITSSTAQVVWRLITSLGGGGGKKMTMREAMREPRVHDQLMPDVALFEYGFDNSTVEGMRERGHNVAWVREGLSSVQGIRVLDDGGFEAVGEPRQKSSAGLVA